MQQAINHFLRCANVLRRLIRAEFLGGVAAGGALCLTAQSWIATYGQGLLASLVCLLTVCAGSSLAMIVSKFCSSSTYPYWARWLSLTAWLGLLPFWISLAGLGPGWFTLTMLESVSLQILAMIPAAISMIGIPVFLITLLVWGRTPRAMQSVWWSLWAGGTVCAFGLMPFVSSQILLWSIVALSLVAAGWSGWGVDSNSAVPLSAYVYSSNRSEEVRRSAGFGSICSVWLTPAMFGFLMAIVSVVVRLWCPVSVPLLMGQAALGFLGLLVAVGLSGGNWFGRRIRSVPVSCWLLLPILFAQLLIICEPIVTRYLLILNTRWSSPYWLLAARILIVSLFPFAIGLSTGIWNRHAAKVSHSRGSTFWIGMITLAGVSWGFAKCLLAADFSVHSLLLLVGVTGLIGGGLSFTPDRGRGQITGTWKYRLSRLTVTVLMGGVILGTAGLPDTTSQLPARVLFSPVSAGQFRAGLDWRLVPYVDDARLMDQISTEQGLLTTYNYHGLETALRRDGIPAGYLSHDYRLMPQFPADALMVVLPSILHGEVRDIAICHWNCGVTVSSALEFPVERVDCFDASEQLVNVTYGRQLENPWAGLNPLTDTRVRLRSVSPNLALRSRGDSYDVIVSDPPRSMLADAAQEMTADFYRHAAERLRPGGLFCQRYLHYDHGPQAWADVLATLQSVYPHVAAIEMIPGETLFVASAAENHATVPDLADRLQKPQIRRVLARFGWDWGHVLRLPTIQPSKCSELLTAFPGVVQTVISPELCQTHVSDALRWANKWNEKTSVFSPFRGRLAELAGEASQSGEIQRRMEEIVAQQNTMSEQVDLPWVYRSKLKEFLSLKPRSEIVQVGGEKPRQQMHPVDKRRVEYLEALSEAHNTQADAASAIDRLANYDTPFDPLISYFLHYEAAELYARLPDSDPRIEFHHRLKTIYFGDVRDKSVRNVVAALNLLLEHDDLVETPQERFDQIHGLVQFLLNRWQLRTNYSPRNTDEALVDIQDSLAAAQRGMETLNRLVVQTDYGAENWAARREYLDLNLMMPLRSYRGRLLPHHERTMRKRNAQE